MLVTYETQENSATYLVIADSGFLNCSESRRAVRETEK